MAKNIIEQFVEALTPKDQKQNHNYSAEVSRIDNEGVVWVYLAGSDKETPTALSSVEIKKGDVVNVEWRNNKLYVAGNNTNPSAGLVRVINVEQETNRAKTAAEIANISAQQAVADAQRAKESADSAQADANTAKQAAESAQDSLKSVVQGATTVEKAVSVMQTALEAVVDYDPNNDTVQEYFWHDANGAHVLGDTSGYRNDIDSSGMKIVDANTENSVAEFGAGGVQIGESNGLHIEIKNQELGFYQDSVTKVASMSDEKLKIKEAKLETNLRIGKFLWTVRGTDRISLRYQPEEE